MVVGICGAAASVHAPASLAALRRSFGERIDVMVTESAERFQSVDALERLGYPTTRSTFDLGALRVPHVQLADGAKIVLIMPATAHFLHRLATGACSDLVSLVATATRAPVVVVPVMAERMWTHPAVQRNVAQVRRDGTYVIEPRGGEPISGGIGRAALGAAGARPGELARVLEAICQLSEA